MIDLSKMEHATPEYQSINPNGLVDDGMRLKIEHCAKRVRVYLGGKIIADSIRSKLVWEVPHYPAYYFPMADVSMDCLLESDHSDRSSTRGLARYFNVRGGNRLVANSAGALVGGASLKADEFLGIIRFYR